LEKNCLGDIEQVEARSISFYVEARLVQSRSGGGRPTDMGNMRSLENVALHSKLQPVS